MLTGASVTHVASGGIAGSEWSVTLVLKAETTALEKAFDLVKSLKGEPPAPAPGQYTNPRAATLDYDPQRLNEHVR